MAFGAGLVFLAHLLDRTVVTPDDAKSFGVPVHGVIGEIMTPAGLRKLRWKRRLVLPTAALIVAVSVGLSALSITLWLQYPNKYREWQTSPLEYLTREVSNWGRALFDKI
jgi:hypothetical protein